MKANKTQEPIFYPSAGKILLSSNVKHQRNIVSNFQDWRNQLLFTGNIVQDEDDTVSDDETESRFNTYIEMIESIDGSEGKEYALAIFESIQAVNDYGAYQTAGHAVWKFGEEVYCQTLIHELPRLIETIPDWAGEFLVSIANGEDSEYESTIHTFNKLLSASLPEVNKTINDFINNEEKSDGWLDHRVNVLGSKV